MENRYIFSLRLKEDVDDRDLSEIGRIFHSVGAAIEKADYCFIVRLIQLYVCSLYCFKSGWGLDGLYAANRSVK